MNLLNRIRQFFYGRYGVDALYYALFVSFLLIWVVRIFVTNVPLAIILYIIELAAIAWMISRVFSKNIYARQKENEKFLGIFRKVRDFFVLQKNRIRDIKKYRYRKCPKCKAVLRLPARKGKNTVRCPRCDNKFEVNSIL